MELSQRSMELIQPIKYLICTRGTRNVLCSFGIRINNKKQTYGTRTVYVCSYTIRRTAHAQNTHLASTFEVNYESLFENTSSITNY